MIETKLRKVRRSNFYREPIQCLISATVKRSSCVDHKRVEKERQIVSHLNGENQRQSSHRDIKSADYSRKQFLNDLEASGKIIDYQPEDAFAI